MLWQVRSGHSSTSSPRNPLNLRRAVWSFVAAGALLWAASVGGLYAFIPGVEDHSFWMLALAFFFGTLSLALALALGIVGAGFHLWSRIGSPGRRQ